MIITFITSSCAEPPQLSIVDLHNLSIDGVDKDIMLCPKSQENHYTKSSS
jgi:hypothetical protein